MASLSVSSSMEALSSSTLQILKFSESSPAIQSIKISSKHCGSLKMNLNLPKTANLGCGFRVFAREISDEDGGEEESITENDNGGFNLVTEESVSLSQGNSDFEQSSEKKLNATSSVAAPPPMLSHGSTTGGGTRAGLFRTPISGGVQSATSAHGLPRPALAVRNLMEQARFAHLCTVMSRMHHRREGYPFGSLVDFAPDSVGHPIFSFSPLAIHTRNLLADPRCTLVVQVPGWSSLSNARVTIFGDVYPLPEDQQEWAHQQYIAKHQQGPSQKWGNFYYFRMQNISDIYFIGGFGTVAWIDVKEYEAIEPDKIAVDGGEQNLKELNAIFSKPLKELLSKEAEVDDAALISIDSKGVDIRVRQGAQFNIQRISFEEGHSIETLEEAKAALWKLIDRGRLYNFQK
ncbi:Pyridoxamine 5'-phosphate oxidase family protein [Forsythia ovata]|uniref:Pyridoxamine 5'-phosphate oxidase family protein n=1 Tax=Forsythia ovata TaxID=205694 RepID=A0ABD1TTU0_9LAMI